ncbi:patatin-like phospholipase family protein [Winogradskyella sp. 3972H.M.0a.05]|uniref:patatin-like phospholipase family protein n=1 Tax=Winogradskyella sp. 3972H.M.0a.05 TaxID=2950277 RepID=UPI0033917B5C
MKTTANISILILCASLLSFCTKPKAKNEVSIESSSASNKTIILAIDGGGIKGIIPAIIIDSIEKSLGKSSYQLFDLIGGTSTGGIISVALTSKNDSTGKPFSGDEIVSIYQKDGSKIFVKQNAYYHATYYASNYGKSGVEPYLRSMVGDTIKLTDNISFIKSLDSSRTKQMFTTSYTVNSTGGAITNPVLGKDFGPYLFNWYDAKSSSGDDYYAWEAARGTSSAPTYFPIANVGGGNSPRSSANERWVVDGGMMSNDPAVWGITEALRTGIAKELDDIIVISIGTGLYNGGAGVGISNNTYGSLVDSIPSKGNWSETPWMINNLYDLEGTEKGRGTIINVILDAVQLVTNSQLESFQKAGLTYYRLEPSLTHAESAMDNISTANIDSLISSVNNYLKTDGATTFSEIITTLKSN